jgi:hypothetical protein
MKDKIFFIFDIIMFYIIRLISVFFGLFLGYIIIEKFIEPNILEQLCISKPGNCTEIEIYRYNNTFIAREKISQIWFWYNGIYLFVYGQTVGSCVKEAGIEFEPVSVFTMTEKDDGDIEFTQFPNQCIPVWAYIRSNYIGQQNAQRENILLYRKDPTEINSIFNVIKNMLNNKIFVL